MERSVLNPASSPPNLAKVPCCAVRVNGGFAEVMVGQGFGRFCFGLCAFTEQGVAMLSSVLSSERAIAVNIEIMRAFVQLRGLLASNKELARRFDQLEARLDKKLAAHDEAIAAILSAIRQLMNPPQPKRRPIGFTANIDQKL